MIRLAVRLTPRAGTDHIDGVAGGLLNVRVRAAPIDGAANEALLRLLSETLDVPRSSLTIAAGASGRRKLVGLPDSARERVMGLWPDLL